VTPHRVPVPVDSLVHVVASPAFSVAPPPIINSHLIPHGVAAYLSDGWHASHPSREIRFHSLRDVFVVNEGLVFDRDLNLFEPSITQTTQADIDAAFLTLKAARGAGLIDGHTGPALLCGKAGLNNYGHFLGEMLPLVWLSRQWIQRGWKVLVPRVYSWMNPVVTEALELLDVRLEQRILGDGRPCHVDELVLVTGLTHHGHYYSPLVIQAMDDIGARVPALSYAKLWMSRAGELRSLFREAEQHQELAAAGWTIIRPGTLTFREQIAVAKGARHMAGVNGAALANLMFMRPGGTLTSFVPAVMPDLFYCQFCTHRLLTYREIRSEQIHELGGSTVWDAPLNIPIENVLSHLRDITGG
jgi:Glycosyltransferase 61